MSPKPFDRRTFLHAAAVAGVAAVAGCGGDGDGNGNDDTPTAEPTEADDGGGNGGGGGDFLDEEPDYGGYLDNANGYEGTLDVTDQDEVSVVVGGHGGTGFDPAAIAISSGTTVTWEWNGQGGQHNVLDNDGNFESELIESDSHTFSHTFEETGTYTYYCDPHEALGMKGGVHVE